MRLCVFVCVFSCKMKKYKSLPVRDSAAAYNELVDNHISTAPQPCTSLLFITLICVYHTQLLIGS